MYISDEIPANAWLDRILQRLDHLRHLDLDAEADVEVALDETRELMGLLALYRATLQRASVQPMSHLSQAA